MPYTSPCVFLLVNALAGEGAVEEFIEAALPGVLMPFTGLVRGLRDFLKFLDKSRLIAYNDSVVEILRLK